jgi:hypothetical protein
MERHHGGDDIGFEPGAPHLFGVTGDASLAGAMSERMPRA